jgi:hypothetical protein
VSETEGKYSVELFREGGEGAGQEEIIDRHDNLTVARAIYRGRVSQYPGRLVMLCDRARSGAKRSAGNHAVIHKMGRRCDESWTLSWNRGMVYP